MPIPYKVIRVQFDRANLCEQIQVISHVYFAVGHLAALVISTNLKCRSKKPYVISIFVDWDVNTQHIPFCNPILANTTRPGQYNPAMAHGLAKTSTAPGPPGALAECEV